MKKLQYTTNDPAASTDYLAADNTWKTIPGGGGGSGIPKGTTSGTDTYTTTISGITSLSDQDAFLIRFAIGNTTGATLNINSLGAKTLYRNNDGALIGGDIVSGAEMFCIYNTTLNGFQVIGTAPNTLLAYVTNVNGSTITRGQPVYAFGGQGDRLTVKLASNSSDATSAQTVGLVVSTSIANNQKGLIMVNGLLDGLSILPTSTWADGDAVYLGATAGTITKVKPSAPNHLVYLGFVTTANNGSAGRMYVRVQNGYELDEIHDVKIASVANNDGLFYNSSNGLWENKQIKTINGNSIVGSGNELVFDYDRYKYGFEMFTDFLSPITTGSSENAYTVFRSGSGAIVDQGITLSLRATNQQGFIQMSTGSTSTGNAGIYGSLNNNLNFLAIGGGAIGFITSIRLANLSTLLERYRIVIGFGSTGLNSSDITGIFFTYDEGGIQNGTSASPNWQCITTINSVRTLTVTSVAATTSAWQKFTIDINSAGTSVDFLIDNVIVATHTTNIPTGIAGTNVVTPKIAIGKSIGISGRSLFADYFGYKQTFTTPRI